MKELIGLLLLGHILGDYYCQTQQMAEKKKTDWKEYGKHCVLYAATILLCMLPMWQSQFWEIFLIISISHAVIDAIKIFLLKKDKNKEKITFFADQMIHIAVILLATGYLKMCNVPLEYHEKLQEFLQFIEVDHQHIVKLALLFLMNAKPCNIMIKVMLADYKTETSNEKKESGKGVGALVGTLERWIIVIFFLIGQYSSIGLVLTAKSIARYNKIAEDPDFAEYYLLGTLLSTIIAIISAIVIM